MRSGDQPAGSSLGLANGWFLLLQEDGDRLWGLVRMLRYATRVVVEPPGFSPVQTRKPWVKRRLQCPAEKWGSRWWFQSFFYFHPDPWGNDPIWLIDTFQMGWNDHLGILSGCFFEDPNLKLCKPKSLQALQSNLTIQNTCRYWAKSADSLQARFWCVLMTWWLTKHLQRIIIYIYIIWSMSHV